MLDTLSDKQKKALANVGLSILGISYGGRIRTNEPDIYALFELIEPTLIVDALYCHSMIIFVFFD
jgi:hypothetical protein